MAPFREFELLSGVKILLGKSAESNEDLVSQVMPTETVLHTVMPGSPFCKIKCENPTKVEIKEAAIYTAKYSQDWRDNKKDVSVHVFRGADIYKEKKMKLGTFHVKKFDVVKVKKADIRNLEENLEKQIK
ncbi:DUF814 domain-containing protein [archaeon]|jgi:predicted ribosome quality control (RQC) complex YloA/Tae2 family protein|nr:DUF814 domain-containing protein [archaeon]MBT6182901.1 DUF814 domain-containing protein [archaeon]MBT6606623.1 DUF814 domain-containing protein [archaeon]MBT7251866.1 DUF814 domain-containing protein [archaeon]MBT7660487.1 DUF814 domain-containing protein [archaeon]